MGIQQSNITVNLDGRVLSEKPSQLLLPHLVVDLVKQDSWGRTLVEQHIAKHFLKSHNAEVTSFLPYILTARTKKQLTSTLGFRLGSDPETFFLEHYLPADVESILSGLLDQTVARNKIAEIGSLTSSFPGVSQMLFVLIVSILHRAGFQWALFTATSQVVKMVHDLDISIIDVCDAAPESLPDAGQSWGGYYKNKPRVIAGNLETAYERLNMHPVSRFMINNYQQTIDDIASRIK